MEKTDFVLKLLRRMLVILLGFIVAVIALKIVYDVELEKAASARKAAVEESTKAYEPEPETEPETSAESTEVETEETEQKPELTDEELLQREGYEPYYNNTYVITFEEGSRILGTTFSAEGNVSVVRELENGRIVFTNYPEERIEELRTEELKATYDYSMMDEDPVLSDLTSLEYGDAGICYMPSLGICVKLSKDLASYHNEGFARTYKESGYEKSLVAIDDHVHMDGFSRLCESVPGETELYIITECEDGKHRVRRYVCNVTDVGSYGPGRLLTPECYLASTGCPLADLCDADVCVSTCHGTGHIFDAYFVEDAYFEYCQ